MENKNHLIVQGTILEIGNAIQGENWIKQDFTIRTEDKYPVLINFIAFNSAQEQLSRCKINDQVSVWFNIESRSFEKDGQKRYFTEAKSWKIAINWKKEVANG